MAEIGPDWAMSTFRNLPFCAGATKRLFSTLPKHRLCSDDYTNFADLDFGCSLTPLEKVTVVWTVWPRTIACVRYIVHASR